MATRWRQAFRAREFYLLHAAAILDLMNVARMLAKAGIFESKQFVV